MNNFKRGDIVYTKKNLANYVGAGCIGIIINQMERCEDTFFCDWELKHSKPRNFVHDGYNSWHVPSHILVKIGEL